MAAGKLQMTRNLILNYWWLKTIASYWFNSSSLICKSLVDLFIMTAVAACELRK